MLAPQNILKKFGTSFMSKRGVFGRTFLHLTLRSWLAYFFIHSYVSQELFLGSMLSSFFWFSTGIFSSGKYIFWKNITYIRLNKELVNGCRPHLLLFSRRVIIPPSAVEFFFEFFREIRVCYPYKPLELFVIIRFLIILL